VAALAAMLIYTGYRLASPMEFIKTYRVGWEQLTIFVMTVVVTLATDLLIGVGAGIVTKFIIHLMFGVPKESLFKPFLTIDKHDEETYVVDVSHSAIFSNLIQLKRQLDKLDPHRKIIIDFTNARVVDHTVMHALHAMERDYHRTGREMVIRGLEKHAAQSDHPAATRRRKAHA
jgi:MFS superfamily sulfate permease-like transporter